MTIRHTAFWNILLTLPDIPPHPGNRILCTLQAKVIPDHSIEPTHAEILTESTEEDESGNTRRQGRGKNLNDLGT